MKKKLFPLKWIGLAIIVCSIAVYFVNPPWFNTIRTFLVATAVGQKPGTILYTIVGHDIA
ncbi:MAG: hypothetical protein WCF60_05515 [Anaerobacillus sp.]